MSEELTKKYLSSFIKKSQLKIEELAEAMKTATHEERLNLAMDLIKISEFNSRSNCLHTSAMAKELMELLKKEFFDSEKPWETYFMYKREKSEKMNEIFKKLKEY